MSSSSQLPVVGSIGSLSLNTTSIQELAKDALQLQAIPQCYIINRDQDEEPPLNLPTDCVLSASIPVIDMKRLIMGETQVVELEKLHSACKEWGFFQLVNHGVGSSMVEKLKHEIEEFYKLPLEEKMRYKRRPGDFEGYGQTVVHSEDQKIDWGDKLYMITNPIHRRKPHLFPELPSSLRESLATYIAKLQNLAMSLLELMAKALNIEKQEMEEMFGGDGVQSVRMTYYPPCPKPELVMGLTPHSDGTAITILLQVNGVGGLQVHKDGVWIPVNFLPDAFVVNIGDILEIISNGIYKSIEHRVTVNSEKERMSIGMFFAPKFQAEIGPSPSLISPQNPPLFKRIGTDKYVRDFFSRKLDGKSFLELLKINDEK